MNVKEQIDYMIQSLQLAKSEIEYAEKYMNAKKEDKDFYQWNHMGYDARQPNGTIIRESLKMVGRLANITAGKVTLSSYSDKLFEE
ncbi:MAG: hypothetical protein J6R59_10055 [Paludibacteraceae bacterium]|nr:hypothetical protein [Paludibacteraceae bacterium]